MSRLQRPPKPPRSPFAPLLSPEQEAARVKQSKRDRKKTVLGIVRRSNLGSLNAMAPGKPRWSGLKPRRGVSKNETRMHVAGALFGGSAS